jgi:hypothetical protein
MLVITWGKVLARIYREHREEYYYADTDTELEDSVMVMISIPQVEARPSQCARQLCWVRHVQGHTRMKKSRR